MTSTFANIDSLQAGKTAAQENVLQSRPCPICGSDNVCALLSAPDRFHLRKQVYRLNRCSSCGIVWQIDPPQPSEMGLHYTEEYHKAIMAAGEGSAASRWKDQVNTISKYKTGGALLDIGCSSGAFLGTMKTAAWHLYGIEMEAATAQRARQASGAEVFVGDVMDAPFAPSSFDAITAFDLIEHVYDPRQFLTKVLEWLKPGGIFYAQTPNIDSWEAKFFETHWFGLELPRHLFYFSPKSARYVMNQIGFTEVLVTTPAVSYVERSTDYVRSTVFQKIGFSATPQSEAKPASLSWKVVRKGIRLGFIRPLAHVASAMGAGPSMEFVFKKS
jgi:2-polyprenyl-3-methyl-5-hydroxy-6-metoxy-1,4-benzoquinol methylase